MNDDQSNRDNELGNALHQWRVKAPLPRGFQRGVWERIEKAGSPRVSPFALWLGELRAVFELHRATACVLLVAAIVAGGGLGKLHASRTVASTHAALGERYIASIDPYLRSEH